MFRSRAHRVPNTLVGWYRRLRVAAGWSRRSAALPAPTFETKVLPDRPRRFGRSERVDHLAMFAEELNDGIGEEYAVNAWRAEQLQRLGLSPTLAEVFAGLVDWHQIAKLVERGCSAQLALEIVR
jgi:hypothetical protein